MEIVRKEFMTGVTLTALRTNKFKSSYLSLTMFAPMQPETVTANALLPAVLRQGTHDHPDARALSAALDELYGGTLEACLRQQGETQCIGFVGSFLDDAFAPDGSSVLEPAAALLGELLLHPKLENGLFCADYVAREGKNLADRIRAQVNDKRQYSIKRLKELMCEGEPYALDKLGFAEEATRITPEQLWHRYQQLLSSAPISVYYCGGASFERVEAAVKAALHGLSEREVVPAKIRAGTAGTPNEVRYFEDTLDVTQGKLALGWRTGEITIDSNEYPALLVLNAIYGGTTTSKLFMNVRERLSLCYFASSMLDKQKGLMIVSSGIEFDQYQKAVKEIQSQFEACAAGRFSEQELEAGRRSVISGIKSGLDSQGRLEDYWLGQSAAGMKRTPEELIRDVEQVTAAQVVDAAKQMHLDTVYFLNGKEG